MRWFFCPLNLEFELIVYTLPACVGCKMTKRKLEGMGLVEGKDYEVREFDNEAIQYARDREILQAPLVVVGDIAWGGYSPDRLEKHAAAMV